MSWRFSINGAAWSATISSAPTEDTKRVFWQQAVPELSAHPVPVQLRRCVVVAQVSDRSASGRPPAGPVGRAKGLLDALHDDRKVGPWYRDSPGRAPLRDDHPGHVAGLAVEVRRGEPSTRYLLGGELSVHGELLASIAVGAAAPNDVAGTRVEQPTIASARIAFASAVREAFSAYGNLTRHPPLALVVRHHPQRDEDNTWATWIAAVCGTQRQTPGHWAAEAPLAGWHPASIASVADPALSSPVVYEVWT